MMKVADHVDETVPDDRVFGARLSAIAAAASKG